jgi:DNA-binding transcriptional LysR family regulator
MDLRRLSAFVAVAEEGGFSAAARRLDTTQSAVSAAVRRLEDELEAPLFERTTHHVALTQAGEALLPHARELLSDAQAARDAVALVGGGLRGTVVVGTMQAQALRPVSIAAVLAGFRERYPHVRVRIEQAGSAAMAARVAEGRLDLAVASLAGPVPAGIELTPLASEPVVLVTAPGRTRMRRVAPSDLAQEPFADMPPTWGTRMLTDRIFAAAGVERTIEYEANDIASVLDLVRHGLAVAVLPASLAEGDLETRPLSTRERFVISLVRPTLLRRSAAAQAFADALIASV